MTEPWVDDRDVCEECHGDATHPCVCPEASLPYQRHSETSMAAAVAYEPRAGTDLWRVLDFLRGLSSWSQMIDNEDGNGATDEEIQDVLNMNPSTQRPRRVDLVKRGLVRDSGRTRPTQSGRKATVWVAVEREP